MSAGSRWRHKRMDIRLHPSIHLSPFLLPSSSSLSLSLSLSLSRSLSPCLRKEDGWFLFSSFWFKNRFSFLFYSMMMMMMMMRWRRASVAIHLPNSQQQQQTNMNHFISFHFILKLRRFALGHFFIFFQMGDVVYFHLSINSEWISWTDRNDNKLKWPLTFDQLIPNLPLPPPPPPPPDPECCFNQSSFFSLIFELISDLQKIYSISTNDIITSFHQFCCCPLQNLFSSS